MIRNLYVKIELADELQDSFRDGHTEASNDEATEVHVHASSDDVNKATKADDKLGYQQSGNFTGSNEMPPGEAPLGPNYSSEMPDYVDDFVGLNTFGDDVQDLTQSPDKSKKKSGGGAPAIGRFHLLYRIDGTHNVLLTNRE